MSVPQTPDPRAIPKGTIFPKQEKPKPKPGIVRPPQKTQLDLELEARLGKWDYNKPNPLLDNGKSEKPQK